MIKLRELLRIRLEAAFSQRGAQTDFIRKSGFGAPTVHHWLNEERTPNLDQLEIIAKTLGTEPWELIKPDEILPVPREPSLEEAINRLDRIEKLLRK